MLPGNPQKETAVGVYIRQGAHLAHLGNDNHMHHLTHIVTDIPIDFLDGEVHFVL